MKKNNLPDYRRETQEILKIKNISAIALVQQFGISTSTAYNWLHGKKSPSRKNFEKLKALAEGRLTQTQSHQQGGTFGANGIFDQRLVEVLLEMPGRMNQLTKQIADLQETCGAIKERLTRIETDIGPQAGVRISTLEQKIFGQPVTEPLKNKPEVSKM